jgi:hypothetical protein
MKQDAIIHDENHAQNPHLILFSGACAHTLRIPAVAIAVAERVASAMREARE